jgi:eukaryotic-like serine/threonine-protein kinase
MAKADDIYAAARLLTTETQREFIDLACGSDAELRAQVDRLLGIPSSSPTTPGSPPESGSRLVHLEPGMMLGHFRIDERIGTGGGGLVYRATDTQLHRTVAIKILPEHIAEDAHTRRRFAREAEAASALNHPNIVTVYQTGSAGRRDYIVMEFIAGETLFTAIRGRGLPVLRLLRYAIEIADALAAAHRAGIVHKDLKTGNIMLDERGHVKVLDFGLADTMAVVRTGQDAETVTVTTENIVRGTCAYMSPEQACGRRVDARSDIFSFGCMLYEMVTGKIVFRRPDPLQTVSAVLQFEPPPVSTVVSGVPRDLERIITTCLHKEVRDRWHSMDDVKILLETVLRDLQSGRVSEGEPKRRRLWPVAAGILCGSLLAGVAAWQWYGPGIAPRSEPEVTMLTADAGLSAFPALSRDGSIFAFASDRSGEGNLDIWVQQIGGRQPIRLTRWDSDESDPDVSPDGTRVVFRSEKDGGGIYVVPTLGGDPLLLAAEGRSPRFAPDGSRVAYWSGREGPGYLPESAHVFVVPTGGGKAERIDTGFAAGLYPLWSPRGDALLILGRRAATGSVWDSLDWWILPLRGQTVRRTGALQAALAAKIRAPHGQFYTVAQEWLGAPDRLLFGGTSADTANMWQFDLAGDMTVRGKPRRVTAGTGFETQASMASLPDGKLRMAYSSLALNFDIWALPLEIERGVAKGDLYPLTNDASYEARPSLSHDGSLLSFASQHFGSANLRLMELPSRRQRVLLSSTQFLARPHISGDGRYVVYTDRTNGIFRISTKGGTVEPLCEDCGTPDDVNTDASRVLVEPVKGPDDLRLLERGVAGISTLVPAKESLSGAAWTADQSWVAFQTARPGIANVQIFAAPIANGHRPRREEWVAITDGASLDRNPAWSPSGNMLYYLSERDGFRCLWAQRLEPATKKPAGDPVAVTHFHSARRSLRLLRNRSADIGLSVAGQVAVFTLGELTGNIWLREEKR